eukprot:1090703-Amphidinium_carterae.1
MVVVGFSASSSFGKRRVPAARPGHSCTNRCSNPAFVSGAIAQSLPFQPLSINVTTIGAQPLKR